MRFEAPRGHEETLTGLFRAACRRKLAHGLLFSGPEGIGKFLSAEWLAFGLLCAKGPGPPCGTCGPCKRLKAGTHADLLAIDPEEEDEEEIKIGRIVYRERDPRPNVGEFLSLLPLEGGWRVVLVRDAERMNEEAQNALLKTLEEPGRSTLLALVTSRPENLLPTTRSRCVRVGFSPLDFAATEEILRAHGLEPAEAGLLARWSGGAPGSALAMKRRAAIAMRARIEGVLRGEVDALAAAREIGEIEGEFPGKTPAAVARGRARACLDLLLAVLTDLARARAGLDPLRLAHGDLARASHAGGPAEPARSDPQARGWEGRLEVCLAARQDVESNLSPEAILERALLAIEPGSRGGGRPAWKHAPRLPVPGSPAP